MASNAALADSDGDRRKTKKSVSVVKRKVKPTRTKKKAKAKAKTKEKVPKKYLLNAKEREEVILEHREHGKRLAWRLLGNWRARLQQDEVTSVVGAALCEAAVRFRKDKGVAFRTFFFYHLRGMLIKEITRIVQQQQICQQIPAMGDVVSGDGTDIGTWSYRLVENTTPEQIMERRELVRLCWNACAHLDPLEQEVLIRAFMYDESLVEIAKELDYCRCHISRVKARALKKLEKILGKRIKTGESIEKPDANNLEAKLAKTSVKRVAARKKKSYTGGRGRRKLTLPTNKAGTLKAILKKSS